MQRRNVKTTHHGLIDKLIKTDRKMLREYLTNTLDRLSGGGRKPVAYPELMEAVRADIAGLLNGMYAEKSLTVHKNVNGVKIITWKGGGNG